MGIQRELRGILCTFMLARPRLYVITDEYIVTIMREFESLELCDLLARYWGDCMRARSATR